MCSGGVAWAEDFSSLLFLLTPQVAFVHSLAEGAGEVPPEDALISSAGASAYIEAKLGAQPPTERQVVFS